MCVLSLFIVFCSGALFENLVQDSSFEVNLQGYLYRTIILTTIVIINSILNFFLLTFFTNKIEKKSKTNEIELIGKE